MTLTRSLDKRGGFIAVFLWQLRRGLPAALLYWALMVGLTAWNYIFGHGYREDKYLMEAVITGFAFFAPFLYLGDCFSRRQADFIHALPAPRGQLYLAAVLNSFWQILLPIIPCRLFTGYAQRLAHLMYIEYNIRDFTLIAVALVGFAFMMAALTGTWHGYILASMAHLVCWRIITSGGYYTMFTTIPVANVKLHELSSFLMFFGSPFAITHQNLSPSFMIAIYIWLPIFGALCAAAGYHLYKRRQSEWAGNFGRCKILERFLRTEMTLAAGVGALSVMTATAVGFELGGLGIPLTLGSMVLAVFGAHLILELVWHRKLKTLGRSSMSIVISGALLAVLLVLTGTGMGVDTDLPETSEIELVDLQFLYPINNIDMNGSWLLEVPGVSPENNSSYLRRGLTSPEMLEKVRTLHKKYLELERAAQYPYLPGRGAYRLQEDIYISYCINDNDGDALPEYEGVSVFYKGPVNSKTEPILEEVRNLRREMISSDEFVNSLEPMCAIDAVSSLGWVEPKAGYYRVMDSEDKAGVKDPRPVEELPKDFRERLEEAMREDFKNGRFTTQDGMLDADYPIYQLGYSGEFTARGGFFLDPDSGEFVPAAGKRLTLAEYERGSHMQQHNALHVTKEMPATYGYLNEVYK